MSAAGGLARAARPVEAALRRTIANLAAWIAMAGRPRRMPAAARARTARRWLAGSAIAVLTVGASMLVDAWVLDRQRQLPISVVEVFNEITDFGKSGWFLWPTGLLVLAMASIATPALGRFANLVLVSLAVRLEFVFAAVAVPGLLVTIVKRLIGRVRPSARGPFAYVPFSWRPDYAGMPSGHATTAFAAAVAIGAVWPRARVPLWTYAVVIAVSRVAIAAHYPSDVIAGGFVGACGALVARRWFAARRLGFVVGPDQEVRALTGPSLRRIKKVAARI